MMVTKKSIDEQIASAEKNLRRLKEKKVRDAEKRMAKRYGELIKSIPEIDGYSDGEYAEFVALLRRKMSTQTDVIPNAKTDTGTVPVDYE